MILGSFFLSAQQGPAAAQPRAAFGFFVPMILIFAVFYLLLILPQRKKQKKHMEMVENLRSGDRIITTGGIFGSVMGVQKDRIELKVASNVKIEITKSAVGAILGATEKPEKDSD
jgi:preprotein translocase subunit YajC